MNDRKATPFLIRLSGPRQALNEGGDENVQEYGVISTQLRRYHGQYRIVTIEFSAQQGLLHQSRSSVPSKRQLLIWGTIVRSRYPTVF